MPGFTGGYSAQPVRPGVRKPSPVQAPTGRPTGSPFPLGVVPEDIAPQEPIGVLGEAPIPLDTPPDFGDTSGPMYPVPQEPTKGRGVAWWLDQLLLGGLGGAMQKANQVPNPDYAGPAAPAPLPSAPLPPQAPASPIPANAPPPEVAQPLFRRRQRQYGQLGGGAGMVGPR